MEAWEPVHARMLAGLPVDDASQTTVLTQLSVQLRIWLYPSPLLRNDGVRCSSHLSGTTFSLDGKRKENQHFPDTALSGGVAVSLC